MAIPNLSDLNFDAMDPSDLDEIVPPLRDLLSYTMTKAAAMRNRAAGQITEAQRLEQICEDLYAALPESWRW